MNKLAKYLNQHLVGEVLVDSSSAGRFATDGSPLKVAPEMVAHPRSTNDIRKLLRFSWQLAEKGHQLPVTARGGGTDTTGGAIGSGIVAAISGTLDAILEFDGKQRLVRLQPGVTVAALRSALSLQGLHIAALGDANPQATVGGVIAAGRNVTAEPWVEQLEIVLANGDILQTKRLSKRELGRKKGQQDFEGELYRELDALIDDNRELVSQLNDANAAGYTALGEVKRKDGSFDLTPLFFASQGSLGIISEMILKAEVAPLKTTVVVGAFGSPAQARDVLDDVAKIAPGKLEYYSQAMVQRARAYGKSLAFLNDDAGDATLLVATLDDLSSRTQGRKAKKLAKLFEKFEASVAMTDDLPESNLAEIGSVAELAAQPDGKKAGAMVPLAEGVYVPLERFDDFTDGLAALASKLRLPLPLYGTPLDNLWCVRPVLSLGTVGGKQAVFKLTNEIAQLAAKCGGHLASQYGEGRLQAYSTHSLLDDEMKKLFANLKATFDKYGILNSGVKQQPELSQLTKMLKK